MNAALQTGLTSVVSNICARELCSFFASEVHIGKRGKVKTTPVAPEAVHFSAIIS
jgi:hypothetical protein